MSRLPTVHGIACRQRSIELDMAVAGDEVAESRFMTQFTKLLIAYLDDYEPGATD